MTTPSQVGPSQTAGTYTVTTGANSVQWSTPAGPPVWTTGTAIPCNPNIYTDSIFTESPILNIEHRLDRIEKMVGIVFRNKKLESTWSELADLGEKYSKLENELLAKEKIWDIIKK